jgi:hypothetical protein
MKLKRSTVALVGVALLLGAGVLIAESQRGNAPQTAEVDGTGETIFPFEESAVTRLQVDRDGEILVFEKDSEGNWQMVEPDTSPAEPGAVAFLLSRLNTDSPLETVTIQPDEVEDFGLADPAGTVIVTLENGTEHRLLLGGARLQRQCPLRCHRPRNLAPRRRCHRGNCGTGGLSGCGQRH